jgi:hypothetical protein
MKRKAGFVMSQRWYLPTGQRDHCARSVATSRDQWLTSGVSVDTLGTV